jgi:hypothetical protein
MTACEVFSRLVAILDRTGIEYMLTGSFASAYYGAPRATQDIDIVIAVTPDQLRLLGSHLPQDTYYFDLDAALRARQREGLFNVLDLATGWKIDFIIRKSRPFSQEEFGRRSEAEIEGVRLHIASAEDVLIAKLEWAKRSGSDRQIQDAAGIVRVRSGSLDLAYIQIWVMDLGLTEQWAAAQRAAAPPAAGP